MRGSARTGVDDQRRASASALSASGTVLSAVSFITIRRDLDLSRLQDAQRRQGMAQRPQIGTDHQDRGDVEVHREVQHGAIVAERRHDAASPFDQRDVVFAFEQGAAGREHGLVLDLLALLGRGRIGRYRRRITPGRDLVERLVIDRPAERGQQPAGVAFRHPCRIEAAQQRLEGLDLAPFGSPMADQSAADVGLADIGARAGHEKRAHDLEIPGRKPAVKLA